jgi:hypothetical protein
MLFLIVLHKVLMGVDAHGNTPKELRRNLSISGRLTQPSVAPQSSWDPKGPRMVPEEPGGRQNSRHADQNSRFVPDVVHGITIPLHPASQFSLALTLH